MDHILFKEETMLKLLNKQTQLMSAAIMTGAMTGFSSDALASASAFDGYTKTLSNNVAGGWINTVTNVSLLGGVALAALGVVGLKQHVENPGNNPMKNGLAKLGFGGILMALGPVMEMIQDTAGTGGTLETGQITAPTF
jgi:hypothetical protein